MGGACCSESNTSTTPGENVDQVVIKVVKSKKEQMKDMMKESGERVGDES